MTSCANGAAPFGTRPCVPDSDGGAERVAHQVAVSPPRPVWLKNWSLAWPK